MSIQRYELEPVHGCIDLGEVHMPNDYGEWVKYDDHLAEMQKKDAEIESLKQLSRTMSKLHDESEVEIKELHDEIERCKSDMAKMRDAYQESYGEMRSQIERYKRALLPERGSSTNGWNVLVLQGDHPVDAAQAVAAISPDYPRRKPTVISASANQPWSKTFTNLQKAIQKFLSQGDPFDSRFAVFPLAPVSACIAAGYLLTNRPRVRLFQHHRIQANWIWPKAKPAPDGLVVRGLPSKRTEKAGDLAICFNLSAKGERTDIPVPKKSLLQIVDVSIAEPSVHWLKSPNQLEALGDTATRVFASLLEHYPNALRWHLFFAGPAPGAVKVGQQLNPTMTPPTQLYEFNRAAATRYVPSILLAPPQIT